MCMFMHCILSSDVIRALGESRAAMLVLEERRDGLVASRFLPLLMINTSRMEEEGEKKGGSRSRHQLVPYISLLLHRVIYSFLMCHFQTRHF